MPHFLSTIPQGSFDLDFVLSKSKAQDTYGYPRLTLIDPNGEKFVAVGFGYSLEENVIAQWLNSVTKSEDAQKRLKEIHESQNTNLGSKVIRNNDGSYYLKAGIGLDHFERLFTGLGIEYEATYPSERSEYKDGYLLRNVGY